MNTLAAFFVLYVGFFAIATTMPRHRKQLLPQIQTLQPPIFWALRTIGWVALAIGMYLCIQLHGVGIGLTLWTGLLTAAALTVSLLALYSPRFALFLVPCAILPLVLA